MNSTTSNEYAIPFISYSQDKQEFTINPEAAQFLASISNPIGIITVAGLYRSGKSYLLNRAILNKQNAFSVGPSINPCTKGLWIWNRTITAQSSEGHPIEVVVIDTEGIGALDEDQNHDSKIFSLAILLSSYFIYNSVGSIDETALQNLSLIVNLTKHIHLKSQANEDVDPEEYSKYFPTFMWIVRDFTLQLVDEEGEALSSNDYLERALQHQKGFSEAIEQKNRVRRLLKTFFKERDCATVVRPLMSEDGLQNLEKVSDDRLRPEFLEQISNIRSRILARIKVKQLNSKTMNGSMLCSLAQDYVSAFNKGVVPNIQNAWIYICKNECIRVMKEEIVTYENGLQQSKEQQFPIEEIKLKEIHKQLKSTAIRNFTTKAVGEMASKYLEELTNQIREKYNALKEDNTRTLLNCYKQMLKQLYMPIESNIGNNRYTSFSEYEKDMGILQSQYCEEAPQSSKKLEALYSFINWASRNVISYFISTLTNTQLLERTVSTEKIKKLEQAVSESNDTHAKEKSAYMLKSRAQETANIELVAKVGALSENISNLNNEKSNLNSQIKLLEIESNKKFKQVKDELSAKVSELEESVRTKDRKVYMQESELDKQKCLFEQKSSFLEKALSELQKKDNDSSHTIVELKKEISSKLHETSIKHDQEIAKTMQELEQTKEKLNEAELSLSEMTQRLNSEIDSRTIENSNKESNDITIQQLQESINTLTQKYKIEVDGINKARLSEYNSLNEKYKEALIANTSASETIRALKAKVGDLEKEWVTTKQKADFNEQQMVDAKKRMEEYQKSYESLVKSIQEKGDINDCKDTIKLQQQDEIKLIKEAYENDKINLSSTIDSLNEKYMELDAQFKESQEKLSKEIQTKEERIEELESQKKDIESKIKQIETLKAKQAADIEKSYKIQIENYEAQIEEKEKICNTEISTIKAQCEESLAQLKKFYEEEKLRLEHKIAEDKLKIEKKSKAQIEDAELKAREELQLKNNECMQCQDEIRELELQQSNLLNKSQSDAALFMQKIESLEALIKDQKDALSKEQQMHQAMHEQYSNNFNQERIALSQKMEKMMGDLSAKERILTTLENKNEQLKSDIAKKDKCVETMKSEYLAEKSKLNETIETIKAKCSSVEDEYMNKKFEYVRETLLLKQQIEFSNSSYSDLKKQTDESSIRYEEKIKKQKEEFTTAKEEINTKANNDYKALQQKYKVKKSTLKEVESTKQQSIVTSEKENTNLKEKLALLETEKKEKIAKLEAEKKALSDSLTQLQKSSTRLQEIDSLSKKVADYENDIADINSNYERDKVLWENKHKFLEQQRDQAKADLLDAQAKFELTIQKLHSKESSEKDQTDANLAALVSSVEGRFKNQIQELNDAHQQICNELNNKIKLLEKDIKGLNEKMSNDQSTRNTEAGQYEKKLQEAHLLHTKAVKDYEDLKKEKELKISECEMQILKERQSFKTRMQELENKYREAETKRGTHIFEYEKEKAKWTLERDHLSHKVIEMQENVEKLEKKKDFLNKELEKIKTEKTKRITLGRLN